MKRLGAVLLLLSSSSAYAVSVTFDDVASGIYFPSGGAGSTALTTPQGFEFGMTFFSVAGLGRVARCCEQSISRDQKYRHPCRNEC